MVFWRLGMFLVGLSVSGVFASTASAANNKVLMSHGLYQDKNGTTWMRCSLGQTWTGKTCAGKVKKYTWFEARMAAKDFSYKGITGWRLPAIEELQSLTRCSNGFFETVQIPVVENGKKSKRYVDNLCIKGSDKPTINTALFPNTAQDIYWSGTPNADLSGLAWYTYFGGGYTHFYEISEKNPVRLVKIKAENIKK